jgi:hypothetical protein
MTDEQISEIYALGRESFFGGQRAFQVQAYPFRMTPQNFARHRNNPNMPFWKMLKEGSDHFEVTRREPKVDVCEKRYVFDAQPSVGGATPLNFDPAGRCPAYEVPTAIVEAVRQKQREDEVKVAELVSRGTPTATLNRGIDGGMNAVFAAKLPNASTGLSEPVSTVSLASAPGTIPQHVNPPQAPPPAVTAFAPAMPDTGATQVATAGSGTNFFSSLARKIGLASDSPPVARPPLPKPRAATQARKNTRPAPARAVAARTRGTADGTRSSDGPASHPASHEAATRQPPVAASRVATPSPVAAAAMPVAAPAASAPLAGSAPVVSSSSFSARWSAVR